MNPATLISYVYPNLHATSQANLGGWTEADLYSYLNRSVRQACADAGFLAECSVTAVAAGTQVVALPANTSAIIQIQWNDKTLNPRTTAYMDARSSDWQSAPGDVPDAYVVDQQGTDFIRLHPYPAEAGNLRWWVRKRPSNLTSLSGLAIPSPADLIAELETIAEARRKGGIFEMPEAAKAAQAMADVLKAAARLYYGGAV